MPTILAFRPLVAMLARQVARYEPTDAPSVSRPAEPLPFEVRPVSSPLSLLARLARHPRSVMLLRWASERLDTALLGTTPVALTLVGYPPSQNLWALKVSLAI